MSRRKRQQRRRHGAGATATKTPENLGGWGSDCLISRGDLRLLMKAERDGWAVPESVRVLAVQRLSQIVAGDSGDRLRVTAARCLAFLSRVHSPPDGHDAG
jgi:hypothetical protein